MKHLSIEKTVEPDIKFVSFNDWKKYIVTQLKLKK